MKIFFSCLSFDYFFILKTLFMKYFLSKYIMRLLDFETCTPKLQFYSIFFFKGNFTSLTHDEVKIYSPNL